MYTLDDLKEIMTRLRAKDGCPWDSVQTHESMKRYIVEETAEVLQAIDNNDPDNLCEELGDLLYQIMIHAEIEKENGTFTIDDVIDDICWKMIKRHPNVFGGPELPENLTGEECWAEIKRIEREERKVRNEERKQRKKCCENRIE
ncbi:MAG: nucleotide pyrophosphohydrolase [Lachnoclostridium sp.]|nr:nucleotide pyrophosphohydrolase [Lachnoclostridium sp.]